MSEPRKGLGRGLSALMGALSTLTGRGDAATRSKKIIY